MLFGRARQRQRESHSIEQQDTDLVIRTSDDLLPLGLDSGVQSAEEMTSLLVLIIGVLVKLMHGRRAVDTEQNNVALILEELNKMRQQVL